MANKPLTEPNQSTRYRIVPQPAPLQTKVLIKKMLKERGMTYTEIRKKLKYHGIVLQHHDLMRHLQTLLLHQHIVRYRTATSYKYASVLLDRESLIPDGF